MVNCEGAFILNCYHCYDAISSTQWTIAIDHRTSATAALRSEVKWRVPTGVYTWSQRASAFSVSMDKVQQWVQEIGFFYWFWSELTELYDDIWWYIWWLYELTVSSMMFHLWSCRAHVSGIFFWSKELVSKSHPLFDDFHGEIRAEVWGKEWSPPWASQTSLERVYPMHHMHTTCVWTKKSGLDHGY